MNIHLPAILGFTRGTRFWHTAIFRERERDRLLLGFVSSSYCGISSCRSKSFQPMKTARQLSASFGHGYNGWLCAVCSKWPESTVVIMFGSAVQRTYKKGHLSLQVTVHVFALLGHVAVFLPVVVPSSHIAAQWWLKWVHKANSCGLVLSNSVFDLVFCFPLSETSNVVLLQQLTQNHGSLYSWLFMVYVWHCMTLYDIVWHVMRYYRKSLDTFELPPDIITRSSKTRPVHLLLPSE